MPRAATLSLLVPVAILSGGLMLAEGWWLWREHQAMARELKTWEKLKQERDWLAHQVPALTLENEAALAAEVTAATRTMDEFKQALAGDDSGTAETPAGPTEAFFELADYVGRMRSRAARAQVSLEVGEGFGFGAYAKAGPAVARIPVIHRQRRAAEYVIERLFAARPQALLAVRREQSGGDEQPGGRDRADEVLELDSRWSVREPGQVESEALQLEFTGDTAVLRSFLNQLATGPRPAVVCGVQVEPLAALATPPAVSPMTGPDRAKFTVTVELVRVVDHLVAAIP